MAGRSDCGKHVLRFWRLVVRQLGDSQLGHPYTTYGIVHFTDGTGASPPSVIIKVVDGSQPVPVVSCTCSSPLVPEDNARNTFTINANVPGATAEVSLTPTVYPPVVRSWQDASGYHTVYRLTSAPNGLARVGYGVSNSRGTVDGYIDVQIVNVGPPPPDFWSLVVASAGAKAKGACTYGTYVGVQARMPATLQVQVRLEGKLPGKPWKAVAQQTRTTSFQGRRSRGVGVIGRIPARRTESCVCARCGCGAGCVGWWGAGARTGAWAVG